MICGNSYGLITVIYVCKFDNKCRRIRDELAKQNSETTDLTTKLDREIHALRAQLEAAKYDVIKYCIGTLVSISAVGLAVIRILL
ncbi:putative Coiled-coil domain-containing protein [Dioscorea sansibarensis]